MIDEQKPTPVAGNTCEQPPAQAASQSARPRGVAAEPETPINLDKPHLDLKQVLGIPSGTSGLRRPAT